MQQVDYTKEVVVSYLKKKYDRSNINYLRRCLGQLVFGLRHLRCLTIICVKPLLLHQLSTKCVLHFPNLIIFFCETLIAFSTAEKLHAYIWKFFKCCWCPHSMVQLKSNVNFLFLAFLMQWMSSIFGKCWNMISSISKKRL